MNFSELLILFIKQILPCHQAKRAAFKSVDFLKIYLTSFFHFPLFKAVFIESLNIPEACIVPLDFI